MIAAKTLKLSLKSLRDFAKKQLPDEKLIELDEKDECPIDIVRQMCDPDKIGIQLLLVPEDCGGMGGGAFDNYLVCEEMARIDLGIATTVFATFLGSDPITVGATPEQKKRWLGRIAEEGLIFAYGATEPDAGSDLGALKTTADRVIEDGKVVGYKINGAKQWISNGGIAGAYTILANTPAGPSWFVVEAGAKGFTHDQPEDKHGIRLSNTAALALSDVYVDADRLIGGVEGQSQQTGVPLYWMALARAWVNDDSAAIHWLEKSVGAHENYLMFMGLDPAFIHLRTLPAFRALKTRVGLPE